MKINFFLIVCALLASAFFAIPARAQQTGVTPEIRGIWIHTYRPQPWDEVMKKIADAGFNCVFVRVARGVNALYPSKILPMDEWAADAWKNGAGTDELRAMIDAAHRNGLEFHAWKVSFNAGAGMRAGAGPAAFYQKMSEQDRLARDDKGVQTAFLNPGDPRNRQMEFDVMMELLDNYAIDGLHFDYIRYTETGPGATENYDYDYGPISRREFEKASGKSVVNWPADVFGGARKIEYEDWERSNIDDVVKRVYEATKARQPRVMVSAAVWRANRKYRAAIKQDWTKWAREGWLDFVVPMDYTADTARFSKDLDEQIPNVAGHIPLAAGIGSYLIKSPEEVAKQIEIARAKGADGYVLFAYNDDKIDAILDLLKRTTNTATAVPSYRAPRANWDLRGGIIRKDAPLAYPVGKLVALSLKIPKTGAWKKVEGKVTLENASGARQISGVGDSPNWDEWISIGMIVVPAGVSQLVLRGNATDAQGKTWPIAVRGPLLEGLDADAFTALQARDLPPQFALDKRAVAVYAGGQAAPGLLKNLQNVPGIDAQLIYHLKPEMWRDADVLIVPQLEDVQDWSPAVMGQLRIFVENGGRLITTHDAVGFRWHPRLFPEIGVGMELSKNTELVVGENVWGVTAGAVTQGYSDHVIIAATPGATVLAREKDSGKAVIVAGKFGRGTVIMNGGLLGFPSAGEMPDSERRVLWELVGSTAGIETQKRAAEDKPRQQ